MAGTNPNLKKIRRRYSDDFRATALAGLVANGGNVERTARALSIPAKTLEQWSKGTRNPVSAQLSDQKRKELTEALEEYIRKLVGIPLEAFSKPNIRDFGICLGILVDKYIALHSLPNRNESKSDDGMVIDVSRMTPEQLKSFGRWIDEMRKGETVKNNAEPIVSVM